MVVFADSTWGHLRRVSHDGTEGTGSGRRPFALRPVSGHLHHEDAWRSIEGWVDAAKVRQVLRHARRGLMGHLYPGMLDVSTDTTLVSSQLGGHMEVLEFDDLRVRVEKVSHAKVEARRGRAGLGEDSAKR